MGGEKATFFSLTQLFGEYLLFMNVPETVKYVPVMERDLDIDFPCQKKRRKLLRCFVGPLFRNDGFHIKITGLTQ